MKMDELSNFEFENFKRRTTLKYYTMRYERGYTKLVKAISTYCTVKYDPMLTMSYFSPSERTIFLRTKNSRILVHEFVHFLQFKTQTKFVFDSYYKSLINEIVAENIALTISKCHESLTNDYRDIHYHIIDTHYAETVSSHMASVQFETFKYLKEVRKMLPNIDRYIGYNPKEM